MPWRLGSRRFSSLDKISPAMTLAKYDAANGMGLDGLIERIPYRIQPKRITQGTNRAWFEAWLERLCQALQGQTHYLILDNAAFHQGGRIQAIAHLYGQILMYLPPYSPELNPIEKVWATLKKQVRLLREQGLTLVAAIEQAIGSS